MSLSVVNICNLALSHIGAFRIQSLTEASKAARECNTLYESVRDNTLEAHDWGFARKREVLALLPDEFTDWDYAYGWPADCLVPRKILDATGASTGTSYDIDNDRYVQVGKVEFETAVHSSLNKRIILTNKVDAELVYTAKVTTTTLFSTLFADAMAYRLAAELAQPLIGKPNLQQGLFQQANSIIARAVAVSANEDNQKVDDINSFVRAR